MSCSKKEKYLENRAENNSSQLELLEVYGARENNLKNIDVIIPRNQFVVITGLSGSGKSSLAFNTIYAEGQRRYLESFSAYARQFMGNLERPDVDRILGLSPVIAIEQKTTGKNPRSTVGTITEIYDFLRLLYARVSTAYSLETGEKMVKYTEDQIVSLILNKFSGKNVMILAPMVKGRKGHYRELFEQISRQGFLKARIDGELKNIDGDIKLDRYKTHYIETLIDKIGISNEKEKRVADAVKTALKYGKKSLILLDIDQDKVYHYSNALMCAKTGISYEEPEPNTFSFNSPYGACPYCKGLGIVTKVSIDKIIPNRTLSIKDGAFAPLGTIKDNWIFKQIESIGRVYGFSLTDSPEKITPEAMQIILYGSQEPITIKNEMLGNSTYQMQFEGIIPFIESHIHDIEASKNIKKWADSFTNKTTCPQCGGGRLKSESLHFRIDDKSISDVSNMDMIKFSHWIQQLPKFLSTQQNVIAKEILRELSTRVQFMMDVGLDYLSLNRTSNTLSGGESQRIRLASQIGSQLVGVLYILDEPSIGLHQRDNKRLIDSLKKLRDMGNSILVVEHDLDMMEAADYIIDVGPGAGRLGGEVVACGTPKELKKQSSLTCDYLNGKRVVSDSKERRSIGEHKLSLIGATGNNLKSVTLTVPLGNFICITGVSGSGKSSLINNTLYPILSKYFYRSERNPLPYESITGLEYIDKVIDIDQAPIGRTPRSNPATYTGVFNDIRKLYAELPEAKIRGYKPGRFSFNVKGGRCETCKGAGINIIEMNFLPSVQVQCETCNGNRYNRETLDVRFKGKSINDVLNMTFNQAHMFFDSLPIIREKLNWVRRVGLGYITLGQMSTTLSGGEAQRMKLSTELSKKDSGATLYILDEPTTGLHFEDIKVLMESLQKLVNKGNTVIVIEHNIDVIKLADYVIDMGPEGGESGGQIIAEGTPEDIANVEHNFTGYYLKKSLEALVD